MPRTSSARSWVRQRLDFLVQIVHDLRSPLTSILFLAETLMQERSGR